jgi:hypothetical protein
MIGYYLMLSVMVGFVGFWAIVDLLDRRSQRHEHHRAK